MAKKQTEKTLIELINACTTRAELKEYCRAGMTQEESAAYVAKRAEILAREDAEEKEALRHAGIVIPKNRTSAAGSTTERTTFRKAVDAIQLPDLGEGDPARFERALVETREAVSMRNGESDGLLTFGLAYAVGCSDNADQIDADCASWYASRKLEGAAHGSALAVPGTVRAACNPFAVYLRAKGEPEAEIARIYARIERITSKAKALYRERHGLTTETAK